MEDAAAKAVCERDNASTEARTRTVSLDFSASISFVMPRHTVSSEISWGGGFHPEPTFLRGLMPT